MKTLTVICALVTICSEVVGTPQRRPRDLIVLIESCKYDEERCSVERVGAFLKYGQTNILPRCYGVPFHL